MQGEDSVQVDRGEWRYRFAIDTDSVAIYRSARAGQELAGPDTWRRVSALGIADVLVVEGPSGWQAVVELADGRDHWVLAGRPSADEAEAAARHFLVTLAEAVHNLSPELDGGPTGVAPSGSSLSEDPELVRALDKARSERDAAGWELLYSRHREHR